MSDFKHNPNSNLSSKVGAELYTCISSDKYEGLKNVKYDINTNQYTYSFGDTSIKLYSTGDILNYYFAVIERLVLSEQRRI